MQWEMMSHFNEKHKEIEKPRCYFLSSVVLCVFFFLVVVVRMKGNSVRIIPSPAAPRPPTLPPRLPLTLLTATSWRGWIFAANPVIGFCFLFFSLDDVRRWRLACRFSYISSRQISAAWRRYVISCFSGPRQIREEKKKLVPKLLEEETES